MGWVTKEGVRQFELEKTRGNVAHPGGELKDLIVDTMGPGSRMSQDVYGDSFVKPPSPSSRSDVFGEQASSQGFRLRKRSG
jgi:hypothetical protein